MARHIVVVVVIVSSVNIYCVFGFALANISSDQSAAKGDCPTGSFLWMEANFTSCHACSVCPAGHETKTPCTHLANTTCSPCAKGYFSEGGNNSRCKKCARCPSGTYIRRECSAGSDAECAQCEPGTYTSRARRKRCHSCKRCPPGSYPKRLCSAKHNTRCRSCRRKQFSENGEACRNCTLCPPGFSQTRPCSKVKDTQCERCPEGKFSPGGKVSCRPCSVCGVGHGQVSACRQDRDTVCFPCPEGLFFHNASQTCRPCTSCRPGTLLQQACANATDSVCAPCPTGTFSSRSDSSACSNCSTCKAGWRVVSPCRAGRDTVCRQCPRGTYSPTGNLTDCLPCSRCSAGTEPRRRCTFRRDMVCRKCRDGYYSPGFGFSCRRCSLCPPGMYVDRQCSRQVDTVCKECPNGTYSERWSSSKRCSPCKSCQASFAVLSECIGSSNTVCGTCDRGYFLDKGTQRCARCSYCYPDNPGLGIKEDRCWSQPEQWRCRPLAYDTNVTLTDHQPSVVIPHEQTTTRRSAYHQSGQQAKVQPEMDSVILDETTLIIIISTAISLSLVILVAFILYNLCRFRRGLSCATSARMLTQTATKSMGQLAGVAKSGLWVVKESSTLATTSSTPTVRYSWPLVVPSGDQRSQPELFHVTASHSALCRTDILRQLEERVLENPRLHRAASSLSSAQDESFHSNPNAGPRSSWEVFI